jgi:hypothetical protein
MSKSEKMKKTILIIFLSLTFISLTSAMYSGETFEIGSKYPIINCSIENNTYDLNGLDLNCSGNKLILKTAINYKPDNFTIVYWINESYEYSHSGSNHRKEIIITEDLCDNNKTTCDEFPSCTGKEFVQRYCISNCGEVTIDYKVCEKEFINESISEIVIKDDEKDNKILKIILLIFGTFIVLYIIFWIWKLLPKSHL